MPTYQAVAYRQSDSDAAPWLVSFVVSAEELLTWASIPQRAERDLIGFQRAADEKRVAKAKAFFQRRENQSPTSLIVGLHPDLVRLARRTGHSRFPVVGADWDDIDGIVHVKKAIAVPYDRRGDVPVSALMVQAVLVPETLRLDPLLLQLRQGGMQLAVVIDEYGGTSGVVTLEDLVEEIVGEVNDEHDRSQTTGRQLRDGSWTVPGMWRPDEVRARVGVAIPDGPAYETVGGWVMSTLGRVPSVGDTVTADGWTARVVDMDGHRVDRVRLERDDRGPAASDDDEPEERS